MSKPPSKLLVSIFYTIQCLVLGVGLSCAMLGYLFFGVVAMMLYCTMIGVSSYYEFEKTS